MNLRRILALAGVFIILFLYGAALVLALAGGPGSLDLLLAALFCTIVIPAVIYGYEILLKVGNSGRHSAEDSLNKRLVDEKETESGQQDECQSGQKKPVTKKRSEQ